MSESKQPSLFELPPVVENPVMSSQKWYIVITIDDAEYFVYQGYASYAYELKPMSELCKVKPRRWSHFHYCKVFMKLNTPFEHDGWDGTYEVREWIA